MDRTPIRRREKKRTAAGGSGLSAVRTGTGNGPSKREALHKRWGAAYDRLCQVWDACEVVQSERQTYAGEMFTSFSAANIETIEKEVAVLENIRKIRGLITETHNTRHQLLQRMTRLCNKLSIATDSALFSNELHLVVRLLRVKARELMELWVALEVHVKPSVILPPASHHMSDIVDDVADLIENTPAKDKLGFNARANPFLHPACPPKTGTEVLTQQEEVQIAKILRCLGRNLPYGDEWVNSPGGETDSSASSSNICSDNDFGYPLVMMTTAITTLAAGIILDTLSEKTILREAIDEEEVKLTMDTIDECTSTSMDPSPCIFPNGTKKVLSPLSPVAVPPSEDSVTSVTSSQQAKDRALTMRAIFDKGNRHNLPPLSRTLQRETSKKRRSSILNPAGPTTALEILSQVVTNERVSTVLSLMQASVEAAIPDSHQHFYLLSQLFSVRNNNKSSPSQKNRLSLRMGESMSDEPIPEESRLSQMFKILNSSKRDEDSFTTSAKTRAVVMHSSADVTDTAPILWRTLSAT